MSARSIRILSSTGRAPSFLAMSENSTAQSFRLTTSGRISTPPKRSRTEARGRRLRTAGRDLQRILRARSQISGKDRLPDLPAEQRSVLGRRRASGCNPTGSREGICPAIDIEKPKIGPKEYQSIRKAYWFLPVNITDYQLKTSGVILCVLHGRDKVFGTSSTSGICAQSAAPSCRSTSSL